ncbi:hypothetical protein [Paenibacillus sp. YAF4_2]|uniref:hypothetical protein n=1 Tax=Paenibacillus sp. YAF4_2 TaxID=3233085 RepID=UPI003F96258C
MKKTISYLVAALIILAVISACGNKGEVGAPNNTEAPASNQASHDPGNAQKSDAPTDQPASEQPAATPEATTSDDASASGSEEILIIIDQTEKPIEGNSFDFVVNKIPEGYMLSKMYWKSEKNNIVNSTQEAIEHGGSGGNGFYISGDGQFMGFFYPDEMKGEKGEVGFTFVNDQGKELTWKKNVTLK